MVIYDNMPELSREEFSVFHELSDVEQAAFLMLRDTTQCATRRFCAAAALPPKALAVISNDIALRELQLRAV